MANLFQFYTHIKNVIRFQQLPLEHKQLVFYSEGKNYWVHLEGLIKETLAHSDLHICYISSGEDDPGLLLKHPNIQTFKIDEGFVRDWLFANIETNVMVMTMPDLNQYQVKRSKHQVHYIYVQHSLVSCHMVYREGAFDHYDTIFCAGPHHIKELRAIEKKYNLPAKNLIEHGYGRLDAIIEKANCYPNINKTSETPKHILIAPSWGANGVIESGVGSELTNQLLDKGYQVTLRPHPMTIKFSMEKITPILNNHIGNKRFIYEANVASQDSLHNSDAMISDWSGAALDYAFGLNKPVLFIDTPRKVNNKHYDDLDIQPLEVEIRSLIGCIMGINDIKNVGRYLEQLFPLKENIADIKSSYVFNIGNSASVGCLNLKKICDEA